MAVGRTARTFERATVVEATGLTPQGADLLRHPQTYLAAVTEAVGADARRTDWLSTRVALSSLGADVIAAGAAMQVLDQHYGIPELAHSLIVRS